MNYNQLIYIAQKNKDINKNEIRYYSTKFEPPKKDRKPKELSENIKKFLAKQEADERRKADEVRKKREELLALGSQDKKATRRVNTMLKGAQSASQSVIRDAVDNHNTTVTLAGPMQPVEDDYGYVSQEASAFYDKMMEKYSKMTDEPKLNLTKINVSANLNSAFKAPDRKAAITATPSLKPKFAPPPMSFAELMKIAEKKQLEPISIEKKEEEKLLTKKQRVEMQKKREYLQKKEATKQAENRAPPPPGTSRIPKLGEKSTEDHILKLNGLYPNIEPSTNKQSSSIASKDSLRKPTSALDKSARTVPTYSRDSTNESQSALPSNSNVKQNKKDQEKVRHMNSNTNNFKDGRPKSLTSTFNSKPKEIPPPDIRVKEFPHRGLKKKPALCKKRRILDSDDSEYDSEMDDFIDDDDPECDYSKYITEIFGYDKSKYKDMDEDVDNMESTFAQQMREEVISAKLGIKEDLEDMKKEEEEKKRKALMKKRR